MGIIESAYNWGMSFMAKITENSHVAGRIFGGSKIGRLLKGHAGIRKKIISEIAIERSRKTVWIHAASLGEFAIARPLIELLKPTCNIVITFFSPSGYEAIKETGKYKNVFYLPWDSKSNASWFVGTIRPDAALFMVSEYWHNYLDALHSAGIPLFLVSAIIRKDSAFFKWYGGMYRKALLAYDEILTLDDSSSISVKAIGCHKVSVMGDPLFDNAYRVAGTPYRNDVVSRFKNGDRVFVAGSIDTKRDLQMIAHLANEHPSQKFLIVPHCVSPSILRQITGEIKQKTVLYSDCDTKTDFSGVQCLVIDFVGALAYLYRYGEMAYVGGGFTPYLHSVVEPAVYGIPVAFGPNTKRKIMPQQMSELGIGRRIRNYNELREWYQENVDNPILLKNVKEMASDYIAKNIGASARIVETLKERIDG